jgi:hypothetical protein
MAWGEQHRFFAITFQINVEFDEQLFERPTSIYSGPDAWRRPAAKKP